MAHSKTREEKQQGRGHGAQKSLEPTQESECVCFPALVGALSWVRGRKVLGAKGDNIILDWMVSFKNNRCYAKTMEETRKNRGNKDCILKKGNEILV